MTTPTPDSNDERDHAALRRMLDHAPDHAAQPSARLRAAVLARAHDALQQPTRVVTSVPWQRRLKTWLGLEGRTTGRGPWQAAFATIALAVLITLTWQHEPVPGPRLDGAQEASTPAPSATLPAPAAVQQPAPAPQKPAPKSAAAAGAPPTSPPKMADAAPAAPSSEKSEKSRVARPRSEAPAAAKTGAPAAAAELAPPPASDAPAPAAAPVAPSARAAAAAPAARARITASASFGALDAWTRLTLASPDGSTRSLSREEAGALAALVDSVARSGTSADSAESRIDGRITFERDGEAIATLELAGNAIRWREGGMPARTGRPPPQLLEALRSALAQRLTGG